MKLLRVFTEHPNTVGESYCEHLRHACAFGFRMVAAGFACLVHAFLPFIFVRTATDAVADLHDCMMARLGTSRRSMVAAEQTSSRQSTTRAG